MACGRWWKWRGEVTNELKRHLLAVCGCLLLSGCGRAAPVHTEADVAAEVFRSTDNLNAMKSATKVTACRIKPDSPETPYDQTTSPDQKLAAYKEGKWIELSAPLTERFREVLVAPNTYLFNVHKTCIPTYGVRVRCEKDGDTLDVNLCFECTYLAVVRDGQKVGGENFDGGRRELVALCKELFPDDAEIQALKP